MGAFSDAQKKRWDAAMDRVRLEGIPFSARFHLHPDVDAEIDMGGAAVSLELKSGEIWIFRHDGSCEITLEPSVYLERNRLKPRPSRQIVLSGRVYEHTGQINWTLAKAQDTPLGVRDLVQDEPAFD